MALITSFFKPATPEQAKEQDSRGFEIIRHSIQWQKSQKLAKQLGKVQHLKKLNAERQRRHRLRVKEAEVIQGLRDPKTLQKRKVMVLLPPSPSPAILSSSDTPVPSPDAPIPHKRRSKRVNWYEPNLWTLIEAAARRTGFSSPQALAHELKRGSSSTLFKTMDRGTIGAWIKKDKSGWTETVLQRVEKAAQAHRSFVEPRIAHEGKKQGPPSRLDKYPGLAPKIVQLLTAMRLSGTLITRAVAKSVVLAFIRTDAPALFQDPRFQCSDSFIRRLLKDWLDWSWRTVTQAAQKLPENHVTRCIDLAHRLTWNIAMHNVPPELVINADQTGISYLGTGRKTWELKGSNQVSGVGKDEKRQFTLMVGVTAAGQILPFQSIFKGSTAASLPSAFSRTPCEDHDFLFTSGGDKHWSSLGSMKQWVTKVLIKHVRREQLRLSLPPTQKAIIVLDCWSVHRGEPFRTWLKTTYPCLILLFIPGGCTGVAQPCDTNVNRILKHLIKSSCVEYLAQETQAQLKRGVKPADVFIDTTVGTLRNASTAWILSAWIWLRDHPETILDAWRQASFGRLNLSYGSLNSPENRSAVHERFHEDIPFALSIVTPSPEIPDDPDFDEDADGPDYDDDCAIDPNILCDIRAIDSQLPAGIVDAGGDFEFAGDEELTDADADGEIDVDDMELDLN